MRQPYNSTYCKQNKKHVDHDVNNIVSNIIGHGRSVIDKYPAKPTNCTDSTGFMYVDPTVA